MRKPKDLPGSSIPPWTLGDRLRKARTWRGIERSDMADSIGCSDRTVSNYELDAVRVPKLVVNHYALLTGVPVEWLFDGSWRPEGPSGPVSDCYSVVPWLEAAA